MIVEYPKSLYAKGWDDLDAHVIVRDAAEEAEARAKGYKRLPEFTDAEPAPAVEAPAVEPGRPRRGRPPKVQA